MNTKHPINFISACNYLYRFLTRKQWDTAGDLKLILKVIETIIKEKP